MSTNHLHLVLVLRSPMTVRLVVIACSASAGSNKNTPLDFWSMYLVDFVDFYLFYCKLDVLYREMCQIHEAVFKKQLRETCQRSPRNPRKWCQQVLLRPSLPHAPGVRMTGVKQTPSN